MALTDQLTAMTYQVVKKDGFKNTWMDADVVTRRLMKKGKKTQGGKDIQVTPRYAAHDVEEYRGLEKSNLARQEFVSKGLYKWKMLRVPLVYAGEDRMQNTGGSNTIYDLVKAMTLNGAESLRNKVATSFFGTGTDVVSATNKGICSFKHIANSGTAANGGVDALSTGVVLAGINKTSDTATWSGYTKDLLGTGHGPTYNNIDSGLAIIDDGEHTSNLIAMHPITKHTYGKTLLPQQRYVAGGELDAGFEVYKVNRQTIYSDRRVPYHVSTFATNMIYCIDTNALDFIIHEANDHRVEPFVKIPDADGYIGYIMLWCELVSDDPRRQLVIHNFDPADTTD